MIILSEESESKIKEHKMNNFKVSSFLKTPVDKNKILY